jgi:MoxR-like ATPase
MESVFFGRREAITQVLVGLVARGHVLVEDVPGVGKTVLARSLARSVNCHFNRIQLTPDMLPSDILGVSVYNQELQTFDFKPGPIFANIVLADEINRTTPRTQSSLLEAMNDYSVTVDGKTMPLPTPFMVIATQNPFEFEGTYLLPENQLDRFLMRLSLGYPSPEDELRVLSQRPAENSLRELQPVLNAQQVRDLQRLVDDVRMDRSLLDYIISLANATRKSPDLQLGLSPRGALSLAQAARATAILADRDYVVPEDIISNVVPVCAHRIITRNYALAGRRATEAAASIMERLMETIESPA